MTNGDGDVRTVCGDKGCIISLGPDKAAAGAYMYAKYAKEYFTSNSPFDIFFFLVGKYNNFCIL